MRHKAIAGPNVMSLRSTRKQPCCWRPDNINGANGRRWDQDKADSRGSRVGGWVGGGYYYRNLLIQALSRICQHRSQIIPNSHVPGSNRTIAKESNEDRNISC